MDRQQLFDLTTVRLLEPQHEAILRCSVPRLDRLLDPNQPAPRRKREAGGLAEPKAMLDGERTTDEFALLVGHLQLCPGTLKGGQAKKHDCTKQLFHGRKALLN